MCCLFVSCCCLKRKGAFAPYVPLSPSPLPHLCLKLHSSSSGSKVALGGLALSHTQEGRGRPARVYLWGGYSKGAQVRVKVQSRSGVRA